MIVICILASDTENILVIKNLCIFMVKAKTNKDILTDILTTLKKIELGVFYNAKLAAKSTLDDADIFREFEEIRSKLD